MLTENTSEIKKLKDIINNIIIKINNNKKFTNLIEKINFYFLEIDKGLICSKPYIEVTNLITSKKQEEYNAIQQEHEFWKNYYKNLR
jgi:hypothetical protein